METPRRTGRAGRRRAIGAPLFGQLLTAAVESAADSIALRYNPTGMPGAEHHLTYRELDERSTRLARELIDRGMGAGDVVAIAIARSIESVLAVWAIAKTGAAYVPVDPAYPADRIAHIVADSGASIGLTTAAHRACLGTTAYWIELDDPVVAERIAARPAHAVSYADRVRPIDERHPAYVIYTSGSTGKPKGVVVTHTGLATLVAAEREHFGVEADSRVLHVCSPNFDVSVLELLLPFSVGATLVISPPRVFGGFELSDLLRRERITHLLITPGALESVDPAGLPDLTSVIVAGDRFGPELVGRWATGGRAFYNGYGPTEATILATSTSALRAHAPITIGSAVPGMGLYVLDARLRPVPAGVVGELYLSGPALAQGYLGRPGLTAERFVASPFGPGRLYRTGDLVRRLEHDGTLEYLGRTDFQVKVRGFRIELGEIDNALTAHPDLDYAVTLGKTMPSGATALVAYVLPGAGATVDTGELAEFLAESLPAYMIPSVIMVLDELPLTPVGKLDRAALPTPVFAARGFRAPATPAEQVVADVFAALLLREGAGRVGADDDFFELGGDSLLAAQAVARIGAALDVRVPVQAVFEAPTVAGLANRAEQQRVSAHALPLTPRPRPALIPLSYAQQRMWFLNRFDPASAVDNIPVAVRLSGRLDLPALRAALADMVARHEVLRTVYPVSEGIGGDGHGTVLDGEGHQLVLAAGDPAAMPEFDVVEVAEDDLTEAIGAAALTGFDVTAAPPVRVRVLAISDSEHVIVCVVHHIAADGFSFAPLTRDLLTAYAERRGGGAPQWPPLPVQYVDYTLWQRELLGAEQDPSSLLAAQVAFWRDTLSGLPEQLELPTDRPRPAVSSRAGGSLSVQVPASVHAGLSALAREHNATLFMVVHTALAMLLARLSGTRDIAIGTPVAGRGEQALDELIGMFVNTLVLRTEVNPATSFAALLAEVRARDLAAFGHADVPFERLVDLLEPVRSTARHPLFQVMLTFQNLARADLALPGLAVSAADFMVPLAKFDLQVELAEQIGVDGAPQGMAATFVYATDLFDRATVADFADRWTRVLAAVVADPAKPVGDIDVLAPGERELVLREGYSQGIAVPEVTLTDLITAQAHQRPEAIAIRAGQRSITFADLLGRASALARTLIAQGAGPETLVAVAVPRTEELPVALLAVLLSGAGYLPIDSGYPAQRLAYIVDDAKPAVLLATSAERDLLTALVDLPVVLLDEQSGYPEAPLHPGERRAPLRPDHLAYVIYTSGSTGLPKGVGVTHRNVLELFANTQLLFAFDEDDVWTVFHSFAFDFSIWELWCALAGGSSVVVVDHLTSRSPIEFRELLAREQVTVLSQTPTAFAQLDEADRAAQAAGATPLPLRYVVFGGEALDPRKLNRWYDRYGNGPGAPELVNMYGITETTVHVSHQVLTSNTADIVADRATTDVDHIGGAGVDLPGSLIGRALPGLSVVVLDDRLRPVPFGVAGELYIAGNQLSRGYLGKPGLTATRFVADPFGEPGARRYRSGDLGRWIGFRGAPTLEYGGRGDQQVQLRGFRIEPGEIEAALLRVPGVGQCAVIVRVDEHAGDRLIAYVVPATDAVEPDGVKAPVGARFGRGDNGAGFDESASGVALDPVRVRAAVAEFLTGYMVPDAVVVVPGLPMTTNGKLDRAALPAPEFTAATTFRAPTTPIELSVAEVFATLLGVPEIGLDDNFFDRGGNSLLATRAIARIDQALSTDLVVRDLFEAPTVGSLAARVRPGSVAAPRPPLIPAQDRGVVPLSPAQQRMWLLNRIDPDSPAYNIPLVLRLRGALDTSALRYAVADVLERHEALRTRFPADDADAVPYQEILPVSAVLPTGLALEECDDPRERVMRLLAGGFDVAERVPLRAGLFTSPADDPLAEEEYVLAVVVQHIIADGASLAPLARDLVIAYRARVEGRSPAWSPLPVQYADYALWQREVLGSESDESSTAARQLEFWRHTLAGQAGTVELPHDHPRPSHASLRGADVSTTLTADVHARLGEIARRHNASLFMVVHAALAVLLARISGSTDIAIGTPIAGRGEPELDDLVGMFVNTLTLRTQVDPRHGFDELVSTAREVGLAAFANADLPFERVVEEVAPTGTVSHNPLFQVVLSFHNNESPVLRLPGLTIEAMDLAARPAKFDLQVNIEPRLSATGEPDEIGVVFTYATDLFEEHTVAAFARGLAEIVTAVAADPTVRVGDIDLRDARERERELTAAAYAPAPSANGAALAQELASAVEEDPDAPALEVGHTAIAYAEFDARSSQLARSLIARGAGPGTGVAVRLDRGVDAAIATWAVLKAGAAVVPLMTMDAGLPGSNLEVKLGLTIDIFDAPDGLDWYDLADPALRAELAAESPRPIGYAHRTRALRGDDVAFVGGGRTLSFDELATAAERVAERTGLNFESRTRAAGRPDSVAGVLEIVAAAIAGATLVMGVDQGGADEVSHVFTESAVAVAEPGDGTGATIVALSEMIGNAGQPHERRAVVGMDG
ncbi:non-ribosomal peptide synthetase [Nocardia alba]|uniref:Amino acid adenylation domain-containing protein n=1 Tax=Nocardia alba TaxID=225051 RepID=A0A4R1FLY6_9NOCA|nr:non-ribosomal peptide synthetase [Nocardia alba]TCJ94269.1 amino acid adenylation domain-containing protein [Nocardia alba]